MEHSKIEETSSENVNSELKRIQSVKQMIKLYRQQQFTIKEALGNLDGKAANKIIFQDDVFDNSYMNKKELRGKKKSLFESDNEDEENYNFEIKDQFIGKEGQKLLELQSKFKGDERFKLDERFIENNENAEVNVAISTDLSLEEEKKNEIDILQKVLGTKFKSNKFQESLVEKHMLRFDPTQSHHLQYEIIPSKKKQTNKKGIKHCNQHDSKESQNQQPDVSKETFYKVRDDFKDTFKSQQEFSLLNTFSSGMERESEDEMEEQPSEIKNREELYSENNPFQYDSSEDELEHLQEKDETINNSQSEIKFLEEPFFFKDDDFRLQEGSDFVRRIASENISDFVEQRKNLKNIVKTKVRNNRKNNVFKKKLGGSKKKKIVRIRKALKR